MHEGQINQDIQRTLRINLNEYCEVQDWSKKFNIPEQKLREAVIEVGSKIEDIEGYLNL